MSSSSTENQMEWRSYTCHEYDAILPCAICREYFVVGKSARRLPCNHLYHCDCIISWLTTSGDDSGLTMWFDVLVLKVDLEEDMEVVTPDLCQSLDG
ncbi:hypothetical protein EUTSA_v10001728mg [Eutrema salsugineum]|uniref:RING-type domain-containing protein n=1 Tax=Eutrema salsugineum TaxID=72664 RepID=V4L9N4_EUTSA|nr:hypothetical protein EUTSA_v10001728mg [Eutrema salsugineum]